MDRRSGHLAGRPAAAFLLAGLVGSLLACTAGMRASRSGAGPPGRNSPAPAAAPRGPWKPTAAVRRGPVLPADPDRDAKKGDFAGSDNCLECHMDRRKTLVASFHAPLVAKDAKGPGCEECHGPGIDHVGDGSEKNIRHPRKAPREASNAVCLRCHAAVLEQPVRGHREWVEERKVSCVACHTVHVDRATRIADHERPAFADEAEMVAAGATYVGPARCIGCHPDYHPDMARSGHADLAATGNACETCHGPGSLHAAGAGPKPAGGGIRGLILNPEDQEAGAADRVCNSCHEKAGRPLLRWTCSEHRAENVACVACHSPNEPRGRTLRAPDPQLCLQCHPDTGNEFRMANHHRVLEGTLTCSDCHDPHANESGMHRFELTRETCLRCHPEKGGPFVYDHAVKRLEGCTVCHRPHGSPGPRLLETHDVRTLCLSCHPGLPRSHEQKGGSVYRDCIKCHIEIHGSDSSPKFFR